MSTRFQSGPPDRPAWQMFDNSPDGVMVECGGAVVYLNDSYATLLGYRHSREVRKLTVCDIADPSEVDRLRSFGACRLGNRPAPQRYQFIARRKDSTPVRLDASVWTANLAGSMYIVTMVREILVEAAPDHEVMVVPGLKKLSARENQIFFGLLAGRRSKEIAFNLGISEKTVGTHRCRVYGKLGLRSDLDLFRFAAHHGLLEDPARSSMRGAPQDPELT